MGVDLVTVDDFNRANAGTLGGNWTSGPFSSVAGWSIVSNQAVLASGEAEQLLWTGTTFVAGPDVEITVEDFSSQTIGDRWIFVRGDDTDQTVVAVFTNADGTFAIAQILATAYTSFATGSLGFSSGDTMKIKVVGNLVTATRNTTVLGSSNAVTVPSTNERRIGFNGFNDAGDAHCTYDNFKARNIGAFPVADRGSAQNKTAASTLAIDMAAAGSITVGNYLVCRIACDNMGLNGITSLTSVTETRSNTWTLIQDTRDPGALGTGITVGLAYAKVVNPYTNGDDITLNFSPTTAGKAAVIEEWTNIDGTTPVAVASTSALGASTTPSIARTPGAAEQTVIGVLATEGPSGDTYTADSDTTSDAPWRELTRLGSTGGTTTDNVTVAGAYKTVNDTSAQTWNPVITSRDWAMVALVLQHPQATGTTLTLTAASVTATAVALTRTLGTRTVTLGEAQVAITAVALTRTVGAVSLALTPAQATIQAQPLTITSTVSVTLTAAQTTIQAVPLTISVGAVSVALTPAQVTITAVTLTRTGGVVTLSATAAQVTITAVALSITTVGPIIFTLSPATTTITPVALTRTLGATSLALSPASVTPTAVALTRTLGGATATLTPAQVSITAVALSLAGSGIVLLSPALVTITPVALARSVGAMNRAITASAIAITPVALTRSVGALTKTLTPGSVTVSAVALTRTIGARTLTLSPASITVGAVALGITGGGAAPGITLTLSSATIAISPEDACALLDEDGRELLDEDGRVLVASSACNAFAISTGVPTLSLSPATVTITAVPLVISQTAISLTLSAATVTITAKALTLTVGARSVSVSPALVQILAVILRLGEPINTSQAPPFVSVLHTPLHDSDLYVETAESGVQKVERESSLVVGSLE